MAEEAMNYNQLASYLLALLLGLTSAGLIVWHVRGRQRFAEEELGERERNFRRRQFRRRVQTSAMIGLLGAAILVGQLLMDAAPFWKFKVIYWIGVLVLVLWIVLLAIADMAATSFYYSREKTDFVVQHAKLQAELRKAREEESRNKNLRSQNGKPGGAH
jgi:sterol desaturase/sphingolipid hydroxylase (fatty acid hydroxylase superfamily)